MTLWTARHDAWKRVLFDRVRLLTAVAGLQASMRVYDFHPTYCTRSLFDY